MVNLPEGEYPPETLRAILANLETKREEVKDTPATGWALPVKEAILLEIDSDIEKVQRAMKQLPAAV